MHPALSVIFFTTLSGAGYGLLIAIALAALTDAAPSKVLLALLVLSLSLIAAGLLSSLAHLGKPLRSWRAFSQWRSSWLSREGVMAIVTFVPALVLGVVLLGNLLSAHSGTSVLHGHLFGTVASIAAIVCALVTTVCTAMIYASLKTIPAWRQALVVPGYLLFAVLTGGALFAAGTAFASSASSLAVPLAALVGLAALATAALKLGYWRSIDMQTLPASRGDAVGMPGRTISVFERPHTQDNFITREMAFAVARKHGQKLRLIALMLFGVVPVLMAILVLLVPGATTLAFPLTALATLAGAIVERWLFFAQAKHIVTLYY